VDTLSDVIPSEALLAPSAALAPLAGLRALADTTRLAIARLLSEGAFNVGEVQDVLGLGQSTASRHLKILMDGGLVDLRREGRQAFYQWSTALSPAQEALRRFVREHCDLLSDDDRTRLHAVYERRAERTRRFFDGPAADALAAGKLAYPNVDVVDLMISRLPACAVAADLGTGAGRLLGPLRAKARRVIGIDGSPRMLDVAARRAREQGWSEVELRLGALEHLPLGDGEADGVVAHLVMHHAGLPETVLAEVRRVLAPGGTLVVGDYLPHEIEAMRQQLADQWLGFEPWRFAALLQAAGFEDVRVDLRAGSPGVLGMFVAVARAPAALRAVGRPPSAKGSKVGTKVGTKVGAKVGTKVGTMVGTKVGTMVGTKVVGKPNELPSGPVPVRREAMRKASAQKRVRVRPGSRGVTK
jgi:ArsR family transcriptional regulator